jgi:hypothetical protein
VWVDPCVVYTRGGLGGRFFSFLYEEIMEEWSENCILEERTILLTYL